MTSSSYRLHRRGGRTKPGQSVSTRLGRILTSDTDKTHGNDMDDAKQQSVDFYKDPDNQAPAGPGYRRVAPRLTSTVPVRFPAEMIAAVKRLADFDGMTVSSWIRRVIAREIKRREPPVTLTTVTQPGIGINVPDTSSLSSAHAELMAS